MHQGALEVRFRISVLQNPKLPKAVDMVYMAYREGWKREGGIASFLPFQKAGRACLMTRLSILSKIYIASFCACPIKAGL